LNLSISLALSFNLSEEEESERRVFRRCEEKGERGAGDESGGRVNGCYR